MGVRDGMKKGTTGSRNQVDQTERSEIVLSDEWTILRRWWIYWKEKQSIPKPKSSVWEVWEEWEIELMREDEEKGWEQYFVIIEYFTEYNH